MTDIFSFKKAIPICGIYPNKPCSFNFLNLPSHSVDFKIDFLDKRFFNKMCDNEEIKFHNSFISNEYESVIIYPTLRHNSKEVHYIKAALTTLYFAHRWTNERECNKTIDYILNYNRFYFTKSGELQNIAAPFKLGLNPMGNDDHIERITRLYSDNIETEYEGAMRYLSGSSIKDESLCIDIIEKDFVSIFNTIVKKLNYNDKYASKLLSSFRLYFDLIPNNDFERNIVTYTTILETLLLNKDEDCQRKKVSVRAACLINDGGDKKDKQIFSTKIYQFYKYRHNIVHDGASFDDLGNEYLVHKEMGFVRHIIYFVIKEIINRNVKGIEEIINIVKNNMEIDGLSNSFNYIEILD